MIQITEGLERRKYQPGQVKFSKSSITDPHIEKIIDAIAQTAHIPIEEAKQHILAHIQQESDKFDKVAILAPILYHTIKDNIVEDTVFKLLEETSVQTEAPSFSTITFMKLVRSIAADQDEFWPLRSYIDKRRLTNPKYDFVNTPLNDKNPNSITTAAATPSGTFIFNTNFMQKLMDYSNLKGVHPKGEKYVSNGGDIPDEYGYIEFLIMHEFMHYSNDDFYYQKVIPNAKHKIINWVGDFRTNYLLVKSGYEQLPMGLFNDMINYDRQKEYIEMYRLVESEFNALPKSFQDWVEGVLDGMGDDHRPGQAEGEESDATDGKNVKPGDIDKIGREIQGQMEGGKDAKPSDRKKDKGEAGQGNSSPGTPGLGAGTSQGVDYSKIMPTFNWKQLVQKFLRTAKPRMEETYSKPHRRGVTGLDIAAQVGAAAIKPAEKPTSMSDAKLGFCFDSSGSMSGIIRTVFANAVNLLKQPGFKNTETIVFKFSSSYDIFRCNFSRNIAAKVTNVNDKARKWALKSTDVFNVHMAGGTDFSSTLAADLITTLAQKWNMIFFLDSDIMYGDNFINFASVLKSSPSSAFVIFDSRQTYINFRQKSGITTANISYFQ